MKKYIILIFALSLLATGVMGFTYIKNNNQSITEITVPIQKDYPRQIKAYQNFDLAVIKAIAKENNIKVVTKEIDNENDLYIALKNGDIDIVAGMIKVTDPKFERTYTYFSGELVSMFNRETVFHKEDYSFAARKSDKELLKIFNTTIREFKENGKMKELEQKYLGERVK